MKAGREDLGLRAVLTVNGENVPFGERPAA